MARTTEQLQDIKIRRLTTPGFYHDGGGLYLQVSKTGKKSWVYRFMLNGKQRDMGLGAYPTFSLADARTKAAACRKLKQEGTDPIDARKAERDRKRFEAAKAVTFKEAATRYIEIYSPTWRNKAHKRQWPQTLESYVYPVFGSLSVQAIDVALVMRAVEPIWQKKPETASRVRQRIEAVLDWATANGFRVGENPARWRGHLDKALPRRSKVQKVRHQPALPHAAIGGFMENLQKQNGVAAKALEFLILTASRTSEVIGARWSEIDLERGMWTVPAARIKAGKEHRIPLSEPALAMLKGLNAARTGDLIFSAATDGSALCNNALLALLDRMGQGDVTVHGFRSTFRDWAAEKTNCPSDVVETALAHANKNKVESAYLRSDLFLKRKVLMDDWATYCGTPICKGPLVSLSDQKPLRSGV